MKAIFDKHLTYLTILIALIPFNLSSQVVINEIMANPSGSNLPNFEYIELYNTSNSAINLADYVLKINSNSIMLPDYTLASKQYVLVCPTESQSIFEEYGNVLKTTRWFALNNSTANIQLAKGESIIDIISYQLSWHSTSTKRNGGWSFERINPNWTCNNATSWSSSIAPNGGTPGKPNSINHPMFKQELKLESHTINGNELILKWNIEPQFLTDFSPTNFILNKNLGSPLHIKWKDDDGTLILTLQTPLTLQEEYELTITPLHLCGFTTSELKFNIFDQHQIHFNDIVINEILFNPKEGNEDFVELYNASNKPIDLNGWKIGNRVIFNTTKLIQPEDYLAITVNKEGLVINYPKAFAPNIYSIASLPAFANQQGIVTLISNHNTIIDSLYYNANMHSPFITNQKGVSLERQSATRSTNEFENFKSASTIEGGATPGYKNSTQTNNFLKKNKIFLRSKTFSPDGDNFEDLLEIVYEFTSSDYMIRIDIYSDKGRLIKRLISQQNAGSSGVISWNGLDDNNAESAVGHYISHIEYYDKEGHMAIHKEAFVLVRP